MVVVVQNPRDCLSNPLQSSPPLMRYHRKPNPSHARSNRAQPKRRSSTTPPPRPAGAKSNLFMGQVKILKRGEEDLIKPTKQTEDRTPKASPSPIPNPKAVKDEDLGSTDRLGPDPVLVPTQIRLTESVDRVGGFYAGSAFSSSPPPSSLPLPGFFTKKTSDDVFVDASVEIMKLLGLHL